MPASDPLLHSGAGIFAAILLLTLIASALTLVTSWILMHVYKRAVGRLMSKKISTGPDLSDIDTTAKDSAPPVMPSTFPEPPETTASLTKPSHTDQCYQRLRVDPWRCTARYAIAGCFFALVMAGSGFIAFSQPQINPLPSASHPYQFLVLFWTFAWPVVMTANIIAATSWRARGMILILYFAGLAAFGALLALSPIEPPARWGNLPYPGWSSESPLRISARWMAFNMAPTLLLIAFHNHRVRAVAPLVLAFMTVLSGGLLGTWAMAYLYLDQSLAAMDFFSTTFGLSAKEAILVYFLLLGIFTCILFGIPGWRLLVRIRRGYQRKKFSDQSLAVDAVWMLFAAFYAMLLTIAGPGWVLSGIAAFIIYKIALRVANTLSALKPGLDQSGPVLLVLRVFSLGKRSEVLFDAVSRHWRYLGNVQLIAGTDLAASTLTPHQFLDFLSGRLGRSFIGDEQAVDRGLQKLDCHPDADGRFRINDFFCHADTWQSVLSRLISRTNVVLMDLRNFTKDNAGCIFELETLLDKVPLRRLVLVVDATTDNNFLDQVLQDSCRNIRTGSPNAGISASAVQPLTLTALKSSQLEKLLQRLCAAVR